ncbi:hypothetical protein RFI_04511, partial [Reticulomyxa filosa]
MASSVTSEKNTPRAEKKLITGGNNMTYPKKRKLSELKSPMAMCASGAQEKNIIATPLMSGKRMRLHNISNLGGFDLFSPSFMKHMKRGEPERVCSATKKGTWLPTPCAETKLGTLNKTGHETMIQRKHEIGMTMSDVADENVGIQLHNDLGITSNHNDGEEKKKMKLDIKPFKRSSLS